MKRLMQAVRGVRRKLLTWAGLAAAWVSMALLAPSGVAQATEVHWSLGVQAPGMVVGLGSVAPAVVAQPIYVQPAPQVIVVPPARAMAWGPPGHRHIHHRGQHGQRWKEHRRDWHRHGDYYPDRHDWR
ncbi:MAG: hypothetical protein RLZZ555_1827 [Pseudomonadota bacterium]|jgi:hypothetical protein